MSKRKPLPENCNGSIDCPVEGHTTYSGGNGRFTFSHIKLTQGQIKTLRERRRKEWLGETR